ncbi:LysR family transcriptional regulator [uncultured Lactobacillus sp.]|uniref:LysR family transcriptional regulator n=1 Tax=uncultured Lactobacillus sp. TaxID=153152 RepID=UPI00280434C6|nr:LysR family transcriptional regulator [uncultured Lactobacillus sp.]
MEINKLKTFVDLADTLSFSKTAENLYITQSSVSKHIKSLEKEIGLPLFNRTNKSVELSIYGQSILPEAKQIISLQLQMKNKLNKLANTQNNILRIGIIPTFSTYSPFDRLMEFKRKNPDISVQLIEEESNQFIVKLNQNQLDLAFVRTLDPKRISFEKILTRKESFALCVSKNDPLSKRKIVNLAELKDKPFIMLAKESLLYDPVIALCEQVGFKPKVTFVSNRISSILEMVGNGQGIAILMNPPKKMKGVKFVPITPTQISYLYFVRKEKHHSIAENKFWQFMKQYYNSNME